MTAEERFTFGVVGVWDEINPVGGTMNWHVWFSRAYISYTIWIKRGKTKISVCIEMS